MIIDSSNSSSFIISSALLVAIDAIYLYLVGKPVFEKAVFAIQKSPLVAKMPPAVFTYVLMAVILNYFIISVNKTPFDAFILGFCTYGIFDFTNLAIFKNYNFKTAIIDTLWGAILFFVTTTYNNEHTKTFKAAQLGIFFICHSFSECTDT